nr:hypothetical protein [Elizabethkingia sp. ASV34]
MKTLCHFVFKINISGIFNIFSLLVTAQLKYFISKIFKTLQPN